MSRPKIIPRGLFGNESKGGMPTGNELEDLYPNLTPDEISFHRYYLSLQKKR